MLLVAHAQLGDEGPDRIQDGVQRIAVSGQDHPGCKRSRTFPVEGIERPVDDFAGIGFAGAGTCHGFGNAPGDPARDGSRKLRLQPGRGAEMVEQVRMGPPDFRSNGLERDGLRAFFEQQLPGRFECGGSALFGVEAFTAY